MRDRRLRVEQEELQQTNSSYFLPPSAVLPAGGSICPPRHQAAGWVFSQIGRLRNAPLYVCFPSCLLPVLSSLLLPWGRTSRGSTSVRLCSLWLLRHQVFFQCSRRTSLPLAPTLHYDYQWSHCYIEWVFSTFTLFDLSIKCNPFDNFFPGLRDYVFPWISFHVAGAAFSLLITHGFLNHTWSAGVPQDASCGSFFHLSVYFDYFHGFNCL